MQIQSDWLSQNSVVGKGILFTGLILFIGLAFCGCGTSRAVKMYQAEMKETYELQKPALIRTSEDDKRPKWTYNSVYSAWQNHTTHAELNHTTSNPKRLSC